MKHRPRIQWDIVLIWILGISFSIWAWYWFIQFLGWLSQYV